MQLLRGRWSSGTTGGRSARSRRNSGSISWERNLSTSVLENARDLPRISDIQVVSHLGANWDPATYLAYDLKVAKKRGQIAGFLVSRDVGGGEIEVLNLAVDPAFRREGIATALMQSVPATHVFLQVRESNASAIALYEKLGFSEVGRRPDYYDDPVENAIVMQRSRPAAY